MNRTRKAATMLLILPIALVLFSSVSAQPSAAQLKALEPKGTVSFVWHRPGTREWSSTYKKYVYSIYWTAKRKTDQPGVFVTIKGYSAFDIIGGRYVYWRDFVSTNSYDGQKPPTIAEINETIQRQPIQEFKQHLQVGEYESLRMAANPDWEWHTMNSVSFTVVAVYNVQYAGGSYGDEPSFSVPSRKSAVDKIEAHMRFRLYRDSPTAPWKSVGVSDRVPTTPGARSTIREMKKLLDRQIVPYTGSADIVGPTRPPVLTQ